MIVQAQAHTSITSSNHHSHSSIMPSSSSSSSSGHYIKCEFCSGLYGIHVGSCGCAMLNATSDAAMHAITASYNINMNANASCNNNDTGTSNNASTLQMSEEEESWLVQSLAEDATTPMTSMGPTPMMGMSAPNIALSTTTNANLNANGNANANMNVVNYHEIDDVTNDVSCVGDFLDEIAHYLEKEQESSSNTIPFDYIDLWVPVLDESVKGVEGSTSTEHEHEHDPDHKHMKLSYAGHIVISNAHNKQNKNLFGKYSTLFSFEPGHGIVGKVYTSGQPIWESDLTSCTYFERSYGAKKYNINTCLGLPINSTIGRIVIIFYTELQLLNTATSKNQHIIHKLQKSISNHWNPFPRWKLSLESGINDVTIIPLNLNGVSPSSSAHTSPSFKPISHVKTSPVLQPTTPVITKKLKIDNNPLIPTQTQQHFTIDLDTTTVKDTIHITNNKDIQDNTKTIEAANNKYIDFQIANLLAEQMPINDTDENDSQLAFTSGFVSLRLLLLRSIHTKEEEDMLTMLRKSYHGYKVVQRLSKDIALLLVQDYMFLKTVFSKKTCATTTATTGNTCVTTDNNSGITIPRSNTAVALRSVSYDSSHHTNTSSSNNMVTDSTSSSSSSSLRKMSSLSMSSASSSYKDSSSSSS